MEENRIDPYQIVGFLLLIACAVWVFYFTPEPALNIDETESAIELSDDQVSKPEENTKSNDLEFSITEIQQELITLENNDLKCSRIEADLSAGQKKPFLSKSVS